MSHRPFQPPAVMTSNDGVVHATSTPSRWAISVPTSMSKPTYLSSLGRYFDCGGYAASVDTVSTPLSQICARRSSLASVVAHTPSPEPWSLEPPEPPEPLDADVSASPQPANNRAEATRQGRTKTRRRMRVLLGHGSGLEPWRDHVRVHEPRKGLTPKRCHRDSATIQSGRQVRLAGPVGRAARSLAL